MGGNPLMAANLPVAVLNAVMPGLVVLYFFFILPLILLPQLFPVSRLRVGIAMLATGFLSFTLMIGSAVIIAAQNGWL